MKRALLLEDCRTAAAAAMKHLLASGFVVERYDDIYRARMACARKDFALYVVDVNVRDGNGLEFVRWLKQTHKNPTVIIWTSQPHEGVLAALDVNYAAKDSGGDILQQVIRSLFK